MTERKMRISDVDEEEIVNDPDSYRRTGDTAWETLKDLISWIEEMIILGSLLAMTVYGFLQWVRLID